MIIEGNKNIIDELSTEDEVKVRLEEVKTNLISSLRESEEVSGFKCVERVG